MSESPSTPASRSTCWPLRPTLSCRRASASSWLPVPVVGELRYGALNSRKTEENLAKVEALVARCRILNVTAATAVVYARLRLELKEKGSPIPENDLWIAALCVEHQVPLADSDAHFDAVKGLERWRPEEAEEGESDADSSVP